MKHPEEMVSLDTGAAEYAVPVRTLWQLVISDRLPSYKFPRDRKTYVKRSELETALANRPKRGRPTVAQPGTALPHSSDTIA